MTTLPLIIQGGMGAGVSGWRLASAVARLGQLGVVSGTAIDLIFALRLQMGDEGGHLRRACDAFPDAAIARRHVQRHFIPGGKGPTEPFHLVPMFTADASGERLELAVLAAFAEVWLAREGHGGEVGINLLEKIQLPNLAVLYGAMLAGVDYVLMGAGIPIEIPGVLDTLARHEPARLRLSVEGAAAGHEHHIALDPREVLPGELPALKRPKFLGIVSSPVVAQTLLKRATGQVDGFVVETPRAGGHNAPPRGPMQLTPEGEPIYGPRDEADLGKMHDLGRPFWLAGGFGRPGSVARALELGAVGVQVGTAFAFCEESGLDPAIRRELLAQAREGRARVHTDPSASPTGFPFKVARLEGTASEEETYHARQRRCAVGYLRHVYEKPDGTVGYRCPGEPEEAYVAKGGAAKDTAGRKCLCNGLMANIGLPQRYADGSVEPALVTVGDDLCLVSVFVREGADDYSARDVVERLLEGSMAGV
jgi:nitronate monooxygenase